MTTNLLETNEWRVAQAALAEAKLPLPPLPAPWEAKLERWGKFAWGTRPPTFRLHDVESFVEESLSSTPADYVAFGQDGHGTNSWFFHYYISQGPVTIFIQVPWGGAYTDHNVAIQRLERRYALVNDILSASSEVNAQGKKLPGRLIVRQTFTLPPAWIWATPGQAPEWHESGDNAMTPALKALREI